jgi:hypothetical protein
MASKQRLSWRLSMAQHTINLSTHLQYHQRSPTAHHKAAAQLDMAVTPPSITPTHTQQQQQAADRL